MYKTDKTQSYKTIEKTKKSLIRSFEAFELVVEKACIRRASVFFFFNMFSSLGVFEQLYINLRSKT